ncbi:MAG: LytR/AlgR family response regulator transcription factor [Bacteroidota bacterium]
MRIAYRDKWLRLVNYPLLGFILRHFGEYEAIGNLMKTALYYGDLAWNTVLVAVSWEVNRRIILYLDQHYSWITQRFQRFVLQVVFSFMATIPIVATMIYLWNEVIIERPGNFDTGYLLVYDFPLTVVFTVLVHMIYTGMYFHSYYTQKIDTLEKRISELETAVAGVATSADLMEASGYRELLVVNYGTSSVPLPTQHVAYIYKRNEISYLKTYDGKEYTSSTSLDNLEELLDPATFYRINRQMVASIKAIRQFKSDQSGKLILELMPPFSDEATVSKKKAAEFKEWLGKKI